MLRRAFGISATALVLGAGCAPLEGSDSAGAGRPADGVVVPDGKADDFLSSSAQEYVVRGRARVTLDDAYDHASESERLQRARELVSYKQVGVAWFLTQYFIDKKPDDPNSDYGGFGGMAKANTYEELDIRAEEGLTYSFAIHQLVAGPHDLIEALPTTINDEGQREFVLTVGVPSNEEMERLETNNEWYRDSPWSDWHPEEVDPSLKEDLVLTIEREVESDDAWFDYAPLFADGKLTIDVHFGWDYHNEYHVRHARSLFDWLRRQEFQAPVERFERLDRSSGPLVRTLHANGHEIEVQVRIFYGKSGSDTDPDTDAGGRQLERDMRESLRTRDVIMFSGHSGPFYGFALANWRETSEGDLDDSEMREVEMPRERYQIVVAEGCDTYHIGEAFRRNPAKPDGRYIDIITTTAPSDASSPATVQDVIRRLIETDDASRHRPQTMMSLLEDLDGNSFWMKPLYGIHGIDDNPQLHPYAVVDNLCAPCTADEDCGGVGNRCVGLQAAGQRYCAASCTTDAGCPDGYRCRSVASSSSRVIYDTVCVPTDLRCE